MLLLQLEEKIKRLQEELRDTKTEQKKKIEEKVHKSNDILSVYSHSAFAIHVFVQKCIKLGNY